MNKQFLKDSFGWGFLLWLLGYILGIVFFMFVPKEMIGWVITPIATAITLGVLLRKIGDKSLRYYFQIGIIWLSIAVIFDYLFIVQLLKPEDGYYKLDVYLYYFLALVLPILVGKYKVIKNKS